VPVLAARAHAADLLRDPAVETIVAPQQFVDGDE
jgi:hypothetical protein